MSLSRAAAAGPVDWASLVRTGSHGGHSIGEDLQVLLQLPDTADGRNAALRFLALHRAEWLAARAEEEEKERQERVAEATAWRSRRGRSKTPSQSPVKGKAAPSTPGPTQQQAQLAMHGSSHGVSWERVLDMCVGADTARQASAAARHSYHVGAPMLKCLRKAAAIKGAQGGQETPPKTRLSSPI